MILPLKDDNQKSNRHLGSFPSFSNKNLTFQIRHRDSGNVITGLRMPSSTVAYLLNIFALSSDPQTDLQEWFFDSSSHITLDGELCVKRYSTNAIVTALCEGLFIPVNFSYVGSQIRSSDDLCLAPTPDNSAFASLQDCTFDTNQRWDIYFPQGFPSDKSYSIQNTMTNKCIDVVNDQQLQLGGCNGRTNQLWLRPGSDLRIETSDGMCIDAINSPGVGGAVALSSCSGSESQKWLYDGTNLKPKYNPNLCLSVSGGNLGDGAKIVVNSCSTSSVMSWVPYSFAKNQVTLKHSGAYTGSLTNIFRCPMGSKIIGITGRFGWYIDGFSVTCDDGTTKKARR